MRLLWPAAAVVSFVLALEACSSSDVTPSTPRTQAADAACIEPSAEADAGDPYVTGVSANDRALASLLMRQVSERRLLDGSAAGDELEHYYAMLEALLEGPTGPKLDVELVGVICTPSVVTTTCTVQVVLPVDEVAYALEVDVTKGRIDKVKMYPFAG